MLVLRQPTSTPKKLIFAETGMMGGFSHISISIHHPLRSYIGVGIIQLVLIMVPCLVLLLDILKIVWLLGPPTFPLIKMTVILMVVVFCRLGVVIVYPLFIPKNKPSSSLSCKSNDQFSDDVYDRGSVGIMTTYFSSN